MRTLLFGLFAGYFFTACAPVHWGSAELSLGAGALVLLSGIRGIATVAHSALWRHSLLLTALRFVMGFLLATLALAFAVERAAAQTVQARASCGDDRLLLRMQVVGLPTQRVGGGRFDARVLDVAVRKPDCQMLKGRLLRLGFRGSGRFWPNQIVLAEVQLRPIRGSVSPGAFDHELHAAGRGVVLGGYLTRAFSLVEPHSVGANFPQVFDSHRYEMQRTVAQYPLRYGGVVLALATGDTTLLEPRDWELLRNSGTVHLLVISGLHVGLVSGLLFVCLRPPVFLLAGVLRLSHSSLVVAVLTSVGGLGYVFWVGAGVPALRAWLMATAVLLGWAMSRRVQPVLVLSIAAIGVVLIDPLAGIRPGFWLSFGLVAWLLSRPDIRALPENDAETRGVVMTLIRRLFGVHVGATAALFPLLLWLGLPVAPAGPLANFLAVPFVTLVVVPWVLLSSVAGYFSVDVAGQLYRVADLLVEVLYLFLGWVVSVWPVFSIPSLSMLSFTGLTVLILFLLLPAGYGSKVAAAVALVYWCWSQSTTAPLNATSVADSKMLSVRTPVGPKVGEFSVQMLDVGQGLALILRTADAVVVYDTGANFPSGFSYAEAVVMPALRKQGVHALDALVISHGDIDHAGGATYVLKKLAPKRVAGTINPSSGDIACQWRSAVAIEDTASLNTRWVSAGVELVLMNHAEGDSSNDKSCVLLIRGARATALFTGDIEAGAEQALLKRLPAGVDLLSVAHHGSKTSSTRTFVEHVRPKWALVSAGYKNRFGHPHDSVVNRYKSVGASVVNTSLAGTITWSSDQVNSLSRAREDRLTQWRLGAPLAVALGVRRDGS